MTPINLLHHLIVSECLRQRLGWPESVRGQMMLGALAPDAHTESPDHDRTYLHPRPGTEVAGYAIGKITPPWALDEREGRAFAVSVIAHLVGDVGGREMVKGLPAGVPNGIVPVGNANAHGRWVVHLPAMRRDLVRATARYGMDPITAEQIVEKRRDVLVREPLASAAGPFVAAEEMQHVIDTVITDTLRLIHGGGAAYLLD